MKEIIKYLRQQINGSDNKNKIIELKNEEQKLFFNLGITVAFKDILWKINQYEQDEIDILDKIIMHIRQLKWYFDITKDLELIVMDPDYKSSIKYNCDIIIFLCKKLFKQMEEQEKVNADRQMIKNKRNTIDITILPYDKYQGQTVEEIIKDLKQMEDKQNDRNY